MKENRKKTIKVAVLILILLLGLGFAALAANLKIDGTVNVSRTSWDVHFENVQITEGSITANPAPTSDNTTTTEMTYTINFTKPGDFFEFTTDIVNDGTIDAMVDVVSNNAYADSTSTTPISLPTYLTSTVTYSDGNEILSNQLLAHNTSEKIKVRVEFKTDIEVSDLPSSGDTSIVFKFMGDYKQSDNNGYTREHVYKPGDLVYFDPVTQNNCNSSTFEIEDIKAGTSTCYKWRVITVGDTATTPNITIQLDHHILDGWSTFWAGSGKYSNDGPITALTALENITSSWTIPGINYTYDTSEYREGYGILACTNGSCKIGDNEPITNNLKIRLITVEEVADIIKTKDSSFEWLPTRDFTSTVNLRNLDLKWLTENSLYSNNVYNNTDNVMGYWTLTPTSNYHVSAWHIQSDEYIGTNYSVYSNTVYGYRPVIEIEKSKLN